MGFDRAAIVTAGAGGIGLATVERLLARGMNVMLVDLDQTQAALAEERFSSKRLEILISDVTNENAVSDVVDRTASRFGRIDALVHVAGGAGPKRVYEIETIEPDTWDLVINLNVRSAYLYCKAVMPFMREQNYGRIITISSTLARGEKGPPATVAARLPYATAKSALIGFTSQLAKDVGSDGITVNTILPGLILGEKGTRIRSKFEALPEEQRSSILAGYPMGRAGETTEVAALIDFLISEGASYITGTAIPVDGGFL